MLKHGAINRACNLWATVMSQLVLILLWSFRLHSGGVIIVDVTHMWERDQVVYATLVCTMRPM